MSTTVPTTTFTSSMKGSNAMLLQEALARTRMREAEQAALRYRQARRLTAGRTWNRLATWTARRARQAEVRD
ncbi:MAG TPA: hypothetical protein VGD67_00270 [Pseudonocardiaceae bacterium]